MRRTLFLVVCFVFFLSITPTFAQINARMLRQPDVSETEIAFVYAGDVWVVPKTGGTAQRLSSPAGEESFPRFAPDGKSLAFSGNYDGNMDIYVMPVTGGVPKRITHHPMPDRIVDWYPDGQSLLFASPMAAGRDRFDQLFKVSTNGGMPERLPIPYGEFGSFSPDGKVLAFTPETNDFRTWKRYRGGWAPDIWLFDLEKLTARNITNNPANDAQPMWHGKTIYFLSDRGSDFRNNIWAYDQASQKTRQVTHFTDVDVHFPSIGASDIVFEAGGRLFLLDLKNDKYKEVAVNLLTDEASVKPRVEKVSKLIGNSSLSPTGKRVAFEARGEVFTVPAEHGPVLNLTASSGVADRAPSWSPDGKSIAYWSDRSGEYELNICPADGSGKEEQITNFGPGFRYHLYWSPDSKKLAFVDQAMRIRMVNRETKEVVEVDKALSLYESDLEQFYANWSPDSRWLAYVRELNPRSRTNVLFVYDTQNKQAHQLTSGYYVDNYPTFDPEGKYLYYISNRSFEPLYSWVDNSWIYANQSRIVAVPLRLDVPSPVASRNDDEGVKDEKKDEAKKDEVKKPEENKENKDAEKKPAPKPVEIELANFEARGVILPPPASAYAQLSAAEGKVVYLRRPRTGAKSHEKSVLVYYDLKEREEQTVVEEVDNYELSADGKKVGVQQAESYAILDLKPKQKIEKKLRTAELETLVDPKAEWRQIFTDAWRIERDFFYDPGMHGLDWNKIKEQYGKLIDDCVTRWDVNFVLGEMIAELNASHTYRGGGDVEHGADRKVGLLGVDWALENGAYRVKHIVRGGPWDFADRSPLDEPGLGVKEGDYILAANGVALDPTLDPWAAFEGLADQTVLLSVNEKPSLDGARKVLVKTISSEGDLRQLEWVEAARRKVDEATGGKVGYVYVPDTGSDGQNDLVRQFRAQFDKEGLIIDERFNSGGQIPDRFVELLNRKPLSFWAVRDGKDWQWPPVAHFGPQVMLINGWSGSGGDCFPYFFKESGLGPLIGTRTWGGLIGISGNPGLVDGGVVTVPTFRMYGVDGSWFKEGHGVDPDIEVVNDPGEMAKGRDPQLERAIEEVLKAIKGAAPAQPKRPPYENRSVQQPRVSD